jgi:drug/metabolite transporter (DMT)-like permease
MARGPALVVWGLLWGLAVEAADHLLGDPFEPLDVVTLAIQVCLAIALWPLFLRVAGARTERS